MSHAGTSGQGRRSYLTRLKFAGLPARYDLDLYDFSRTEGIDQRQMRELRELVWIRRTYNLLLVGDSEPERHSLLQDLSMKQ